MTDREYNYFQHMLTTAQQNRRECQQKLVDLRRDYYHKPWFERFLEKVTREGFPLKADYQMYSSAYLLLTREWGRRIRLFEKLIELNTEEINAEKQL